jgi:hypothetical protein
MVVSFEVFNRQEEEFGGEGLVCVGIQPKACALQ